MFGVHIEIRVSMVSWSFIAVGFIVWARGLALEADLSIPVWQPQIHLHQRKSQVYAAVVSP
jgi:hypothetical protein